MVSCQETAIPQKGWGCEEMIESERALLDLGIRREGKTARGWSSPKRGAGGNAQPIEMPFSSEGRGYPDFGLE